MVTLEHVLTKVNNRVSGSDMMDYTKDDLENLISAIVADLWDDLHLNRFVITVDEVSDGKYKMNVEFSNSIKVKSIEINAWDKKETFAELLHELLAVNEILTIMDGK